MGNSNGKCCFCCKSTKVEVEEAYRPSTKNDNLQNKTCKRRPEDDPVVSTSFIAAAKFVYQNAIVGDRDEVLKSTCDRIVAEIRLAKGKHSISTECLAQSLPCVAIHKVESREISCPNIPLPEKAGTLGDRISSVSSISSLCKGLVTVVSVQSLPCLPITAKRIEMRTLSYPCISFQGSECSSTSSSFIGSNSKLLNPPEGRASGSGEDAGSFLNASLSDVRVADEAFQESEATPGRSHKCSASGFKKLWRMFTGRSCPKKNYHRFFNEDE